MYLQSGFMDYQFKVIWLLTQFWILYKHSPIAKVIYFDFQEKKMSALGSQYTKILGRCKLMDSNQNQVILPYQSPF